MATLGDYLKGAAKYVGIGGAAVAAVMSEPVVGEKIHHALFPPAGIEQRLKEATKAPTKISYSGGIAYAQGNALPNIVERVTAEEYYKRATPAEFVAPGAKTGPYGLPLIDIKYAIIGSKWDKLYDEGRNGSNRLYDAISKLNGKAMEVNGTKIVFDSEKVINYIKMNGDKLRAIAFSGGFMQLEPKDKNDGKIIIPVTDEISASLAR